MNKQIHVYIIGDVIGVGFRAWTFVKAKELNLTGWVRNNHQRHDVFGRGGGVEALFQGPEDKLLDILHFLRIGPSISRVDDIETYWKDLKEIEQLYMSFEVRK